MPSVGSADFHFSSRTTHHAPATCNFAQYTHKGVTMEIIDLPPDNEEMREQAARLLTIAFRGGWPGSWSTIEEGREEVAEALEPGKICRIALEGETVLGWIGGTPEYNGNVWQLHPLLVHPDHQSRGIGRALVENLEEAVRARGALTLHLGTDDEADMTSLSGIDLYPDVTPHIQNIRNLRGHPYSFYQKLGFAIVGVLPDANGFGKPDILMAKRVAALPEGFATRPPKDTP